MLAKVGGPDCRGYSDDKKFSSLLAGQAGRRHQPGICPDVRGHQRAVPTLFRTVITPLLEAIEESQDEIIGLGKEYMELLESLSVKH